MSQKNGRNRILIATGGTGGHLFPAQALAREFSKAHPDSEILFVGKGLGSNRCFLRSEFSFQEVSSASLSFKKNFVSSFLAILRGIKQSYKILKEYDPSIVIGFGSFYSFPTLVASLFKKVPFVLFEPNAEAGKVNRLFSRWAKVTAIQFSGVAEKLKGKILEVQVPLWQKEDQVSLSQEEARSYFYLDPAKTTLLVFGGSQGAAAINQLFLQAAKNMHKSDSDFQIIHIAGDSEKADELRKEYERSGILACVKPFEDRMNLAWRAASLVVCRAGAASLAEQIAFEVPGILIPYPYAADDHQKKNALFMETCVKGAVHIPQMQLTSEALGKKIQDLLCPEKKCLEKMRLAMGSFKMQENKMSFVSLVDEVLCSKKL